MIQRLLENKLGLSLEQFPVTGIIGPRQVGKTTLVRQLQTDKDLVYLDLERNSDLNKLQAPELFLTQVADKTVVLDEVQHLPELFPLLRSLVDDDRRAGRFVILGSASPPLLRQSSESLAGRINYLEMFPLNLLEVEHQLTWQQLWLHGGFPEPALSGKPTFVQSWYRNFIQSYVQRDLPLYGLPADPKTTRQLLQMIASVHGGLLNYSMFAKSLDLSVPTIKTYLSFLNNAFLTTQIAPWHTNLKKRLVKSPKLYIRDSGMLHYLTGINDFESLMGNVRVGNSWEGFVIGQIASILESDDELYHYRTQDGAEIDLLVRRNDRWLLAAEIKLTNSPTLTKGTHLAMQDLGIDHLHVITPSADTYPIAEKITVISLGSVLEKLKG
ncbi:ATP-binding protein [Salmonirosea aquatica]|uniref:AAA family ATPase n=1 Tax=Salmonirosea aquatica TaxID=2654236 RepID=A0A7C9FQH6_9BACT|nr:AAA family ATPase [Cytophagaceae bacterium SJW1-29]